MLTLAETLYSYYEAMDIFEPQRGVMSVEER